MASLAQYGVSSNRTLEPQKVTCGHFVGMCLAMSDSRSEVVIAGQVNTPCRGCRTCRYCK